MEFFKVRKFRRSTKHDLEENPTPRPRPLQENQQPNNNNGNATGGDAFIKHPPVSNATTPTDAPARVQAEEEQDDDDDDDFFTNEVKRRLKELRRNSFMVLIPEEESCPEEEEEDEEGEEAAAATSSGEWRDVEAEGRQWWGGFDAFHDKYSERMLFFHRTTAHHLKEAQGSQVPLTPSPSPRSASKKLASPLRCLSLKKIEEPDDEETQNLQQPENGLYQDLETTYVAHVCLSWEALHCQYTQMVQKISCEPQLPACYNSGAQQFQQFQVLLQRFIENEPFQQGLRPEIYARTRITLPKLLQVPNAQAPEREGRKEEDSLFMVLAPDLVRIIENAILTFRSFLKMDKRKPNGVLHLLRTQIQLATPLHQVQSLLEKKTAKLKELRKRQKGWKKKSWPEADEDVQLLFGLIDVKILSRVLRMEKISKEQLFWCEQKMKKLDLTDGRLLRDPSPLLFPC